VWILVQLVEKVQIVVLLATVRYAHVHKVIKEIHLFVVQEFPLHHHLHLLHQNKLLILAYHRHVDPMQIVVQLDLHQLVLVAKDISVLLQIADLNVFLMMSVLPSMPVFKTSAEIHAEVPVVMMQNVGLSITRQFALVSQALKEIHSVDVPELEPHHLLHHPEILVQFVGLTRDVN